MDNQAAKKLWDSMANNFAEMEIPTDKDNFTLKIIAGQEMCRTGSKVLDVGCGAGRYAIALAGKGAEVWATDFSVEMIEAARKCSAAHGQETIIFSQDDWANLDLKAKEWENKFDLVLCSMTPAIRDEQTIRKAISASKKWLVITKPCRRINSILDKLTEILGLSPFFNKSDQQIKWAFDILWDMGKNPQMRMEEQVWTKKRNLSEAIKHYCFFIESNHGTLTGEQKQIIKQYLTEFAVEGMIEEITNTAVYALYCEVN